MKAQTQQTTKVDTTETELDIPSGMQIAHKTKEEVILDKIKLENEQRNLRRTREWIYRIAQGKRIPLADIEKWCGKKLGQCTDSELRLVVHWLGTQQTRSLNKRGY